MFLSIPKFKRMIKAAYRHGGIHLASDGYTYKIASTYWTVLIQTDYLPKEIKACIIELTGAMPITGEAYHIRKVKGTNAPYVQFISIHPSRVGRDAIAQEVCRLIKEDAEAAQKALQITITQPPMPENNCSWDKYF